MPAARIFCVLLAAALPVAVSAADSQQNWPAWRGPLATASPRGRSAADLGRGRDEHPLEDGDSRPRPFDAHRLGRPHLSHDRHPLRRAAAAQAQHRARQSRQPAGHAPPAVRRPGRRSRRAARSSGSRRSAKACPRARPPHRPASRRARPSPTASTSSSLFGSFGLYCLDLDGKLVWKNDFGPMQIAARPRRRELAGAARRHAGRQLGPRRQVVPRRPRQAHRQAAVEGRPQGSHVLGHADRRRARRPTPQVIVSGTSRIRGYDLATGKVLWECGGLSSNIVASPVAGTAWSSPAAATTSGPCSPSARRRQGGHHRHRPHRLEPLPRHALRPLAAARRRRALLPDALSRRSSRASMPRPAKTAPARSGWKGSATSTPRRSPPPAASTSPTSMAPPPSSAAAKSPAALALNQLTEPISASAAIAGRELFLRGEKHLYCLAEK